MRLLVCAPILLALGACSSDDKKGPSRPPMTADRLPPQKDYEPIPFEELAEVCEYSMKVIDDCRDDPDFIQLATIAMERLALPSKGDQAGFAARCQDWHGTLEVDPKEMGFWGDQYAQIMDVAATASAIDCGTIGAVVATASVPK
jgi:hypothetical protein